jgi:alanine dehydrogenase
VQALFTYLHLPSVPELINMLLERKVSAFAYETLEVNGELPLLKPMSEIAGKMAPVMGAYYLQKFRGGRGVLMTGAEGVAPAKVVILGAGTVGMGALQVSHGMGAEVTVLNRGEGKLKIIDDVYKGTIRTLISSEKSIKDEILDADVVIGAVLVTGAKAPRLVSKELVAKMNRGSVIVDVSVDQGGCIETTRPSTHNDPVYMVDGVIHYTVANMPGAYPRTSTLALTAKTLEYIRMLAKIGIHDAVDSDTPLRSALNIHNGLIMHKAVAASLTSQ